MTNTEQIKHNGAVNALKDRIDILLSKLRSENWDYIKEGFKYKRFTEAKDNAYILLREIDEVWNELQKLEPDNS